MRYTNSLKLPLYDYPQDADLTKQYESAMNIIDHKLGAQTNFQSGQGVPQTAGDKGSVWLDTSTNTMYVSDGKEWEPIVNRSLGEDREANDHDRGNRWYVGHGNPSRADVLEQDMYFDQDSGDIWQYKGNPISQVTVKKELTGGCSVYVNGEYLARNWMHDQGRVEWSDEFKAGKADVVGKPNYNNRKDVVLPTNVYVAPFSVESNIDIGYDLYFHLVGGSFDSGRHFEHHSVQEQAYESIAEIPISAQSIYAKCVFTIDPDDDKAKWVHNAVFTTYGLYTAQEYAKMLDYGIRWFDTEGNIQQDVGWTFVCNVFSKRLGPTHDIPAGGDERQILTKASDKSYDVKWADPLNNSKDIKYTGNGRNNVSEALDDVYHKIEHLHQTGGIRVAKNDPDNNQLAVSDFQVPPEQGDLILTPSGVVYHVLAASDATVTLKPSNVTLTGPQGKRGATIAVGTDTPDCAVTEPKPGDLYLNTDTYDLFKYKFTTWENKWEWNCIGNLHGDKGEAGLSPKIGDNGNWFVGDKDTGVKASQTAEDVEYADSNVACYLNDILYDLDETRQVLCGGEVGMYLTRTGTGYDWRSLDIATDAEAMEYLGITDWLNNNSVGTDTNDMSDPYINQHTGSGTVPGTGSGTGSGTGHVCPPSGHTTTPEQRPPYIVNSNTSVSVGTDTETDAKTDTKPQPSVPGTTSSTSSSTTGTMVDASTDTSLDASTGIR